MSMISFKKKKIDIAGLWLKRMWIEVLIDSVLRKVHRWNFGLICGRCKLHFICLFAIKQL